MTVTYSRLGKNGRLGNQLWQIASTIGIALSNGHDFVFPIWDYEKEFDNKLPTDYLLQHNEYEEKGSGYQDIFLSTKYDWDISGYFQSWKYFKEHDKVVRHFLEFRKPCYNGVAVHIRRGDYLGLQHIHPVLGKEYYDKAFDYFRGEQFTIFSDDIEWCKENFLEPNVTFYPTDSVHDIHDFKVMAGHQYFIIANSSYSWWAAYLSGSTKVIAPKLWVHGETSYDRIPIEWIKI